MSQSMFVLVESIQVLNLIFVDFIVYFKLYFDNNEHVQRQEALGINEHKLNPIQREVFPWHWPATSNCSKADCVENAVRAPLRQIRIGVTHTGDINDMLVTAI